MVRAMVLQPEKLAEVRFIDLNDVKRLVGTDFEIVSPFDDEIAILVNAQGKILGLPENRAVLDEKGRIVDIFAGPMIIINKEQGDLTDEEVEDLLDTFGDPEIPKENDISGGIIALLKDIFS